MNEISNKLNQIDDKFLNSECQCVLKSIKYQIEVQPIFIESYGGMKIDKSYFAGVNFYSMIFLH